MKMDLKTLFFTTFRQSDGDLLLNTCFPKFRSGFVILYIGVTVETCFSLLDQWEDIVRLCYSDVYRRASGYKPAIYIGSDASILRSQLQSHGINIGIALETSCRQESKVDQA